MIEAFRRIGEEISKEFKGKSEIERKKAVLGYLSNKVKLSYSIAHEKEKKDKMKQSSIIGSEGKNGNVLYPT